MINAFTAIDFETAQGYRWSICQVGLVKVVDGMVTDTLSLLVQPPYNYYWQQFTDEIHGISAVHTVNEPTFDKIWHLVEPYITNQHVVAHNGFGFDFQCLEKTLEYYGISAPTYTGHCTYRMYGRGLASLCKEYKIELNHHDALSDAMACAKLFLLKNDK